ncbi:MAG TPA: hypothetical protein VN259_15415 [Xanthomonadales bacterium]|nr:hypothetical protein [Xanthomonadales bacterium]
MKSVLVSVIGDGERQKLETGSVPLLASAVSNTDTNNHHRSSFARALPLHSRSRCGELRDLTFAARCACPYV